MSMSSVLCYIIFIGMVVTIPVGIINFIVESIKAKKENRPRKQSANALFAVALLFLGLVILFVLFLFWLSMAIVRGM